MGTLLLDDCDPKGTPLPLPFTGVRTTAGAFLACGGLGGGALCTLCCSKRLRLAAMDDLSPAGANSILYAKSKYKTIKQKDVREA